MNFLVSHLTRKPPLKVSPVQQEVVGRGRRGGEVVEREGEKGGGGEEGEVVEWEDERGREGRGRSVGREKGGREEGRGREKGGGGGEREGGRRGEEREGEGRGRRGEEREGGRERKEVEAGRGELGREWEGNQLRSEVGPSGVCAPSLVSLPCVSAELHPRKFDDRTHQRSDDRTFLNQTGAVSPACNSTTREKLL